MGIVPLRIHSVEGQPLGPIRVISEVISEVISVVNKTRINGLEGWTLFDPLKLGPLALLVPYPNGNKGTVTDS
jgi:hypothetical protein